MHSDPIADLLARIHNGSRAHLSTIDVPHSKLKLEIVRILQGEGFVKSFEVSNETKFPMIRIALRYDPRRNPLIHHIRRVSRPGLRVYKPVAEMAPIRNGLATQIVSTSQGVMTDREARRRRIGGEILCEVW
jgi:small subunit ribosomal protein S8